jgi:hypothetical protein
MSAPEQDKNSFNTLNEVLILHEKLDKMGSELEVVSKAIQSLTQASLSHSEAFLGILKVTDMLKNAIILLEEKNK